MTPRHETTASEILRISFVSWLLLIVAAFLEGTLRRVLLEPVLQHGLAELLGIFAVLATAALIAYVFMKRDRFPKRRSKLLAVGLLWATYTAAFDFVFFHLIVGVPWEELIENYNVGTGHLFLFGLAALPFVPWLVARHAPGLAAKAEEEL